MSNRVLGQLPMRTIPHQIKIKPNHCPPGPQSLGLFPYQDNSPLGPLTRSKTTHQDQNLYGGKLSSWGVVRIWSNSDLWEGHWGQSRGGGGGGGFGPLFKMCFYPFTMVPEISEAGIDLRRMCVKIQNQISFNELKQKENIGTANLGWCLLFGPTEKTALAAWVFLCWIK